MRIYAGRSIVPIIKVLINDMLRMAFFQFARTIAQRITWGVLHARHARHADLLAAAAVAAVSNLTHPIL